MNPDDIKAAIEALKNGDGAAALTILESLLIAAASGQEEAAEGAPSVDMSAAPPPDASGGNADPSKDPNKAAMSALARGVIELFGGDAGSALVAVRAMKADNDKRAADAAALEGVERRGLVAELVKLEVEVPATAWLDPEKKGADLEPAARLAAEPLVELRKRVSLIRSTRGTRTGVKPPASAAPQKRALNREELAYCKRNNITPEEFETRKQAAARRSE